MVGSDSEDLPLINSYLVEQEKIRSLTDETSSVARICTDIVSWVGPLPSKPSLSTISLRPSPCTTDILRSLLNDSSPDGRTIHYTPALERMLDVVQIYLKLLINYMNQMPDLETFGQSELVQPSRNLRLPALVWMLWARLKFLNNQFKSQTSKITTSLKRIRSKDSDVQTIESSIENCETCTSSQEMVARLAEAVETLCTYCQADSAITRLRREMKTKIYDVSQWGAMRKWCDAILKDVHAAVRIFNRTQFRPIDSAGKSLEGKGEDFPNDLTESSKDALVPKTRSLYKMNELSRKYKLKIAECNEWQKKYYDLEMARIALKNENTALKQSAVNEKEKNIHLRHELQRKLKSIDSNANEVERMKKEFASLSFAMQNDIASRDMTISNLNEEIRSIQKRAKRFERLAGDLKNELDDEKLHGAQIWKSYQDLKIDYHKKEALLERNCTDMDKMMKRLNAVEKSIRASTNLQ